MKNRKMGLYIVLLIAGSFILKSAFALGEFVEKNENLNVTIDQGISKLVINADAGFLKIRGEKDLSEVDVNADLKVYEGNYKLTLVKKGNSAVLNAEANTNEKRWVKNHSAIDLTIKVPEGLAVSIRDGSGDIEVSTLKNDLTIDDGSGDIEIKDIGGAVFIDDGSGDIDILAVASSIKIDDGSGDVSLHSVLGSIRIKDGSGDIKAVQIDGRVTIDDGSGDIHLNDLKSGVKIINEGSGSVYQENVGSS